MKSFLKNIVLAALIMVWPAIIFADPIPGVPNPGEKILIIYLQSNETAPYSTYSSQMKDAWVTALSALVPAPTIQLLEIPSGDTNGIYDNLQATYNTKTLDNWCEVFDLRFLDTYQNKACAGLQDDVLTYVGLPGTTDWDIFTAFLNRGGHLYLQGEHHDYYCRNQNLVMFINSVAKVPMSETRPNVSAAAAITIFNNTPDNFSTDPAAITGTFSTFWCGGISLANMGSGHALVQGDLGAYTDAPYGAMGGMSAIFMGWLPADLKTNGRLVVGWETNGYTSPAYQNATSNQLLINIYDWLASCYKYSITKTFATSELCVGAASSFNLCYDNTGIAVPSVDIWDTIPTCLNVTGFSSPPAENTLLSSGRYVRWHFAPLAPTATTCITVNFTILQAPPCP